MSERKRIGLREVRALPKGGEVWDAAVTGFGARRQNSDAVAYVLLYRTKEGRSRRFTIGRHGAPWTPDEAREEARRLLGEVARGNDPASAKRDARQAETVAELCDLYLADAEAGRLLTRAKRAKKATTLATDRGRIERHIKPLLGRLRVPAMTRTDAETFMHRVAEGETAARTKTRKRGLARVTGGKGTASRTMGLLGAIFGYAVAKRMRADNPVRGIARFADGKRERRLADEEYAAFGTALAAVQSEADAASAARIAKASAAKASAKTAPKRHLTIWPAGIACARFLLLTGWRRGEATGLRWADIDLAKRTARLADTKTGASMRPLSLASCDLLERQGRDGEYVFPAPGGGPMLGIAINRYFSRITRMAKLPAEVTPHVLRHSFASLANDLGYSDATVGALIGHKGQTITSRYMHAADAVLLAAADAVASETLTRMGQPPKVVFLRPRAMGA